MKILPVFIPHLGCPFQCIYCNQKTITKTDAEPLSEVEQRISAFCHHNKNHNKQIAFFGGTFTKLPRQKQQEYFALVKPYQQECTIRISTRPDCIDEDILDYCRQNNVKTIELGIQSFHDSVLSESKRGYKSQIAQTACKIVKDSGFELGIQLMPGLPNFNVQTWQETLQTTKSLQPDFVRIYPAVVLKHTHLEKLYERSKYKPLSLKEAIDTATYAFEFLEQTNIKIIKTGLHSDIEPEQIVAGPFHDSFGELVRANRLAKKIIADFSYQTLILSSRDVSLLKGFNSLYLNKIKAAVNIEKLPVIIDPEMGKGRFLFTEKTALDYW
jgi:histone acetyltransferase (RNA polymerase elongator complex component)